MATVLAGPRIGEHVACQRGQSKCVVKFAIAQLNVAIAVALRTLAIGRAGWN
jgi:hypothetical protein